MFLCHGGQKKPEQSERGGLPGATQETKGGEGHGVGVQQRREEQRDEFLC